jgi:hypothetical protein
MSSSSTSFAETAELHGTHSIMMLSCGQAFLDFAQGLIIFF